MLGLYKAWCKDSDYLKLNDSIKHNLRATRSKHVANTATISTTATTRTTATIIMLIKLATTTTKTMIYGMILSAVVERVNDCDDENVKMAAW